MANTDTDTVETGAADDTDATHDGAGDEPGHPTEGEGYECPFCGSTDTERESAFGSEISKEQHYCHGCRTVFERLKYDGKSADTGR